MKADLYINGYIGEMFDLFGESNNFSLNKLNDFLNNISSDVTELDVHINSGGGLVTEGFAIHDKLVNTGLTINTIVEGMCGSIATVIAQAGKTGTRKMFQNSEYFIHNPLWIPSAPDAHTADDLEKLTAELKRNEVKLVDFYAKVTGADRNVLSEKMKVETTLTSSEAKDLGFIDEIISTDIQAFVHYKLVAAVDISQSKTNKMAELKDEFKTGFSKLEKMITNLMKGKTVNMEFKKVDGTSIFTDTDLVQEGSKVFLEAEMITPLENGDYELETGEVITVVDGVVTAIVKTTAEPTEAELQAKEIAELKASLAAKESELQNIKAEKETLVASVAEVKSEFVAFQNKIVTGGNDIFNVTPDDNKTPKPVEKKDWRSQVIELRNKK